ncbi:MAG: hypothetical protein MJZ84_03650 [Paludibacteraceae bacterium]|nr:hypothetical protein [Paludibacteraceae bacterium]
MKKILLSLLVLAASANIFAIEQPIYNVGADIQIKGNVSQETHLFTVAEVANANPSKFNAEMYEGSFGTVSVALYAIADSKKYEIFASNDIDGQALGVKTYTDTEYTLTFSNLKGEGKLYLFDAVANKYTEITEGGSYVFTAEANQTIADRFSITKVLPAKPYSFINNTLVITEATGEVTVTPFTYGAEGKNLGTPENHDPSAPIVLSGNYFLVSYETAEGTREFIVNANPDVQPAND